MAIYEKAITQECSTDKKQKVNISFSDVDARDYERYIFPRVVDKRENLTKLLILLFFKCYCVRESSSDQSFRVNGTNTDEVHDGRYGENMKQIHYSRKNQACSTLCVLSPVAL